MKLIYRCFLAFSVVVLFANWLLGSDSSGRAQSAPVDTDGAGAEPVRIDRPRKTIPYTLQVDAPGLEGVAAAFQGVSLLVRLSGSPPDSLVGLQRRLREDLGEAQRVLQAYGYYDGVADGTLGEGSPVPVLITMKAGERYVMGESPVYLVAGADRSFDAIPSFLSDVDLPQGAPAVAANVLDAVDRVRDRFRRNGYPFARIAHTRYVVHHDTRTLVAEITVDPGPAVLMGGVDIQGDSPVRPHYFEAMQTWKTGQPWDQRLVENYRTALSRGGIFQSVTVTPAPEAAKDKIRDIVVDVRPGPQRTISGSLRFDSDLGFGVQGAWEHRNLTGAGDRLRLEAPVWRDSQKLTANYRLPFFLRNDQDLLAQAAIINEDLNTYEQRSVSAFLGVERRLSRWWWGSLGVSGEIGDLRDPGEAREKYTLLGVPGVARYNNTDSLLDATRGMRASLSLIPYTGTYGKDFNVVRTRLDTSFFQPLVGEDTLVLALRGAVGSMFGASSHTVPATVRFYSGGGGSVRGYDFQSIGPQNNHRRALGGSSFQEVSAEGRWKWNETWGAVAFIDGGAVHSEHTPQLGNDMQWGAGLGLRLYTAIGPIRFDAAVPLNPRDNDGAFQIYISIGQSF